jgi:L-threonylcarbamoyladenylate synthase
MLIDSGAIVIFPTDTVYGIGCDPFNDSSVLNLFKIKNRPLEKHLPILTNDVSNLSNFVKIPSDAKKLIRHFWPGPLTLILQVKDDFISPTRYAFYKTVAIRIPNNKCTLNLIQMTKNKLLVGTSANLSKQNPFSDIMQLTKTGLNGYDAVVIKEEESNSLDDLQNYNKSTTTTITTNTNDMNTALSNCNDHPLSVSTIVDLTEAGRPRIIREGVIPRETIFLSLDKIDK